MSNYAEAVREAQKNFLVMLYDEDQGNLTFKGNDNVPDLNVNSPRDLVMLRAGTILSINGDPWMLIEARSSECGLYRYWACRNGMTLTSDELYIYALKNPHNVLACLHRERWVSER